MSTMIPTIPTVAMTAPAASTAKATNIANNNCANNNCVNSDGDGGGNSRSGAGSAGSGTVPFYRVRQSWDKKKTQIAAFTKLENAKNCVDCNPGFAAFDEAGKQVYPKVYPKEVKQS